jgi:hypothetical protein
MFLLKYIQTSLTIVFIDLDRQRYMHWLVTLSSTIDYWFGLSITCLQLDLLAKELNQSQAP